MKILKPFIAAFLVVAVVGGSLAFKTKKGTTIYCTSTQNTTCLTNSDLTITTVVTDPTAYCTTTAPSSGGVCNTLKHYTFNQ